MSSPLNGLIIQLRPYAQLVLENFPRLSVSSVFRSIEKQNQLYQRWYDYRRRGYSDTWICQNVGICTPAPPGRSYHNYGRAFDLNGSASDLWLAGAYWKRLGGRWNTADPIHFEA